MKQKIEIRAVSLVRQIRDDQARRLVNRPTAAVIEFFNRAAERAVKRASRLRLTSASVKASNRGIQSTRRQK
ncbi:MAG: hypothetical protein DMG06_30300 [Acidobacteria bacterium]|nr:MAG: hypothetical protein DMG06_30300 [Acidobacteriota bacterium]